MEVAQVLRQARQSTGLSQRELSRRSGVGLRTVVALESGERDATTAVLERLLRACELRLDVAQAECPARACPHLAEHLSLSLGARWRRAVQPEIPAGDGPAGRDGTLHRRGAVPLDRWRPAPRGQADPLDVALDAAARFGRLELEPAAAVAVWVPGVAVSRPVLVVAHSTVPDASAPEDLLSPVAARHVVLRLAVGALPPGLVPVRVGGGHDLHVLPPAVLAGQHACRTWRPALLAAAALLHQQAPRDVAGRRAPAHRQPDEDEEARRLSHSLAWTFRERPSATDSRAHRLGAPVSLAQWVRGSQAWPDS